MAFIKYNNHVKFVKGRAGNSIYKVSQYGYEFTDVPVVNNPKTASQTAVRGYFTKAAKQWKTLTGTQIAAWRQWANLHETSDSASGKKIHLTGFNWFVGLGSKYLAINPTQSSCPATPPTAEFDGDTITVTPSAQTGGMKFTASAANASKTTTALMIQPLANAYRTPSPDGYRTKAYFAFATGSLSTTVALPPGYYAVAYRFVNTQTGQESGIVEFGVVGPVSFAVQQGGKKAA